MLTACAIAVPRSIPVCVAFAALSGVINANESTPCFCFLSDLKRPKLYDPSVAPSTTACAPDFASTPAVSTMPVASEPKRPAARTNAPAALRTSATVVSPFLPRPSATRVAPLPPATTHDCPGLPSKPSALSAARSRPTSATDGAFREDADADGTRVAWSVARDREVDGHCGHSGSQVDQVDLAGNASPSCQRAMVHSRSERRLR